MRLTSLSTLSMLAAAIGLSFASTAQAAKPPAPDLSNSEFQQCLDRLKGSSKFRSVDSFTFNNYRPAQPDPSVIQSLNYCLLYTSPSPRDRTRSRMPSSA